jgi:glutamate---cysteine ligase / carboxylate-amine ligase
MTRLGGPLDVLDHRFGAGPALTVGVEEEFMLLDRQSLDLVQQVERILAAERRGAFAELVSEELFESLIELHTPVCASVADVERELRRLRTHGLAIADSEGLRLGAAGTHPFSLFERQRVTGRERYRALVDDLQYAARRELIFGTHVHVAVDDPDRAVRVVGALQAHMGELVALSASSPFWRGELTGLASCRHLIFSAFPRSGPPPQFSSYEEFAAVIGELVDCGCIEDYTRTWWDVRLHPRFGTVEVRVMDAVSRVEDAVALTAYVQALVAHYVAADQDGEAVPSRHSVLTHENKWRAARYGLQATVIDLAHGGPIPITELIERTLREIAPGTHAIGCDRELEGVRRIVRDGNGADRQLAIYAATGDPREVARDIANVTQAGLTAV